MKTEACHPHCIAEASRGGPVGVAFPPPDARRENVLRGMVAALLHQLERSGEPIGGRDAIWYGPHSCERCGERIIKRGSEQGPELALDASDPGPAYPNTRWQIHECQGDRLPRAAQ